MYRSSKTRPSNAAIKVADEIWVAAALLHREHPEQPDFSVNQIVQRAIVENLSGQYRQGLQMHASHHCVAQKRPNPPSTRHRMLTETSRGRRRLFRPGDPFHIDRKSGKTTPNGEDLPGKYRRLLDWYENEYASEKPTPALSRQPRGVPGTTLLKFAGTIPKEELRLMEQSIDDDCERVDADQW